MKFSLKFLVIWLINSLLFYLANLLYPTNFVLGTALIPFFWSIVISGFLLTVICKLSRPLFSKIGIKLAGRMQMFLFYWAVNFVAIWIIARLAPVSGFGITRFYWAIGLGFVASFVQWIERQFFKAKGWTR